jgi:hypothetical protein
MQPECLCPGRWQLSDRDHAQTRIIMIVIESSSHHDRHPAAAAAAGPGRRRIAGRCRIVIMHLTRDPSHRDRRGQLEP